MRSWALITGGSVRLGREIGLAFARAGWHVACHYNRSDAEAQALCAELRTLGVDALAVQGDLEDEASCQSIFETTVAITGTALQCVVNNASLFVPDEGADFDEAQALAQIKVNLMAPMRFGKWMAALHAHDTTVASHAGNATKAATILSEHLIEAAMRNESRSKLLADTAAKIQEKGARAADLRRDTQGAAIGLGNKYGFDEIAGADIHQEFTGAIIRHLVGNNRWQTDFRQGRQPLAKYAREV